MSGKKHNPEETGARVVASIERRKQRYKSATLRTRIERVSTRLRLYRMSRFPGSEQVATNISANILLLEERQPKGLGDLHGSGGCIE